MSDLPPTPANHPDSIKRLAVTLRRLDEAHRRYRVHAAKVVGMAPTDLSALLVVSESPGITPGALARELLLSTGTVTAVVDRLEASGRVARVADPGDRRSLRLQLTEQGTEIASALDEAYWFVLSTTGTDDTIAGALPQLDSITEALDAVASEVVASDAARPGRDATP
jgi:DNA-binding MarR family transcriptional regulator